ncbi:hypothetical protein AVT04_08450 [Streptococcus thermophilus]|uniref:Uncharacterized protein n=1 Tax=Streptococcus thermophilus (strain ATCC BAA-250 / LMG 18311) TaxID=264199 RepID=Q5M3T3_STRT2|nr:hypothetical protein stu1283 [Streptococcus thermophilus LMG 18311]AAV62827.1 hypothetical protein str1283 [Streptococcus thermophilus CNRZ1066]ALX91791.1 hypothetical protein AVT04_08450 [Streptococcus thermophilus]ANS61954.1 hypothetical protein BAY21_08290 [Streptococcus thermophilus]
MGNALVVIAILIFDDRKGALVATVALGLFDIFNGYAAEVWITILESLIVCLVLYLVFEKLLKSNDKIVNVIIAGVIAALTKIILNFLKYTIINTIVASLPLKAAMLASVIKIGGTFWNISCYNHCGSSFISCLQTHFEKRLKIEQAGPAFSFRFYISKGPNLH